MKRMNAQRGATLVIALVMLVLLTLFALSALNTSTSNLKVVGNMQARTEAFNAAQEAIETVISTPLFTSNPSNAVVNPCGSANTLCIDKDGNITQLLANALYTTKITGAPYDTVKPACITVRPIRSDELVLTKAEDLACAVGQAQQFGVGGATSGDSLCANSVWHITAETTAVTSGATSTVTQGIGIRISTDDMATSCS